MRAIEPPEHCQGWVRQGFVWLAGRGDLCGEWSQAGGILRLGVGGPWYAALPDEAWPAEEGARADILKVLPRPCDSPAWNCFLIWQAPGCSCCERPLQ